MLTRRQIRVKVMQVIYAQHNGNPQDLKEAQMAIKKSCFDMLDLYLLNFTLFKALWEFAKEQNQIQSRDRKSNNPVNPDYAIIENLEPLAFLAQQPALEKLLKAHKINFWELQFNFVKSLFESLTKSDFFITFKLLENPSPKKQLKLLIDLFKEEIAPNETLYLYLEDLNIHWVDDLPFVNTYLLKQLRKIKVNSNSSMEFPSLESRIDDINFGLDLYEKVIINQDELNKEFEGKTPNWDPERIARLDSVLIQIAIAELLFFPEIPPKVTLNEYLEIAKEYSTPRSNSFINGVLDKLVKEYMSNNRMNKKGRGLME